MQHRLAGCDACRQHASTECGHAYEDNVSDDAPHRRSAGRNGKYRVQAPDDDDEEHHIEAETGQNGEEAFQHVQSGKWESCYASPAQKESGLGRQSLRIPRKIGVPRRSFGTCFAIQTFRLRRDNTTKGAPLSEKLPYLKANPEWHPAICCAGPHRRLIPQDEQVVKILIPIDFRCFDLEFVLQVLAHTHANARHFRVRDLFDDQCFTTAEFIGGFKYTIIFGASSRLTFE